jgi:hypothetical protein
MNCTRILLGQSNVAKGVIKLAEKIMIYRKIDTYLKIFDEAIGRNWFELAFNGGYWRKTGPNRVRTGWDGLRIGET